MPIPNRFDSRRAFAVLALAACLAPATAATASAGAHPSVAARAGVDIAVVAAHSWAPDAALVYLENDEELDPSGTAERWGYLFFSPSLQKARGYSVRDGKILVAENLEMKIEPPAVAAGWVDSPVALQAATREAEHVFKQANGVRLTTMLLMRGAFDETNPDRTTWMLVYTAPDQPSLFVVVDAAEGKVRKTWRG